MRIRCLLAFCLFFLLAFPALTQQGSSQLKGTVAGPDGAALPGVTVTAKNQDSGLIRTTVSDKDGVYVMSAVIPGTYDLTAELSGFKNFRRRNIRLEVGKTSTVDFKTEHLEMGRSQCSSVRDRICRAGAPLSDVRIPACSCGCDTYERPLAIRRVGCPRQ